MLKKLFIGIGIVLLVVVLGLWMAPARLASQALVEAFPRATGDHAPQVRLLSPRGTLWDGAGTLLVNQVPVGSVQWQVRALGLLALEAGVDWQLQGDQFEASGTAAARRDGIDVRDVNATLSESFLQNTLGRYDIAPSGTLTLTDLDITDLVMDSQANWPARINASGNAHWTGGPVRYRLAGQSFDIQLPPMNGVITTAPDNTDPNWPELQVTNADDNAPLLIGRLTPRGSAAIGITMGFTRLAGQPWPGSEPDHAVVLEVEELLN